MTCFTELSTRAKLLELLRWIGVLPAVVLAWYFGSRVGWLLVRLAVSVGLLNSSSDMAFGNTCARYLVWLFPEGMACIIAGSKTAPRCRIAIACIVAVLWSVLTDWIHHGGLYTIVPTAVTAVCGIAIIFYSEKSRADCKKKDQGRTAGDPFHIA